MSARALHYVFRIGDRQKSYDFYTKTLLMNVLRHEEFGEGCTATCNGPYAGRWSKTMIGYGHEDKHFVLELTYNYGIGSYELGNDYECIHIEHDELYNHLKGKAEKGPETSLIVRDPDGHMFYIYPGTTEHPIRRLTCNVRNLNESHEFWSKLIGMKEISATDHSAVLTFGSDQCALELKVLESGVQLNRGTGFGRFAFSYPTADLKTLQEKVAKVNPDYVQKELVKLDTPGKESVWVVIFRDPNEHEICAVGDIQYFLLAQYDPDADKIINEEIAKDDSAEWYSKKGKPKPAAKA